MHLILLSQEKIGVRTEEETHVGSQVISAFQSFKPNYQYFSDGKNVLESLS